MKARELRPDQLAVLRWLHKVRPWGRRLGVKAMTVRALARRDLVAWGVHGWVLTAIGTELLQRQGLRLDRGGRAAVGSRASGVRWDMDCPRAPGDDAPYVSHDWVSIGQTPSGRTRWECRRCGAHTVRATDPPVTGLRGRCGSCPKCGQTWDSGVHWVGCLGRGFGDLRGW
jgi:hypothetical protein